MKISVQTAAWWGRSTRTTLFSRFSGRVGPSGRVQQYLHHVTIMSATDDHNG
jgi:hypothetical protein